MLVNNKVKRILPILFEVIGITNAAPKNPADKLISKSENNLDRTILKLFIN